MLKNGLRIPVNKIRKTVADPELGDCDYVDIPVVEIKQGIDKPVVVDFRKANCNPGSRVRKK